MTSEIISIIAVGIALVGLVLVSNREITRIFRAGITAMRGEMAELREWMARVEGISKASSGVMSSRRQRSEEGTSS